MAHLCMLKAQLAQLRRQEIEKQMAAGGGGGDGWDVKATGDSRVGLIGFRKTRPYRTLYHLLPGKLSNQNPARRVACTPWRFWHDDVLRSICRQKYPFDQAHRHPFRCAYPLFSTSSMRAGECLSSKLYAVWMACHWREPTWFAESAAYEFTTLTCIPGIIRKRQSFPVCCCSTSRDEDPELAFCRDVQDTKERKFSCWICRVLSRAQRTARVAESVLSALPGHAHWFWVSSQILVFVLWSKA
jgi:hypothetical protein